MKSFFDAYFRDHLEDGTFIFLFFALVMASSFCSIIVGEVVVREEEKRAVNANVAQYKVNIDKKVSFVWIDEKD